MPETQLLSSPAPMEGHGSYNRSSQVQATGSMPAIPIFEQAARAVPLPPPPQSIVIADYGSSQGHNSLLPMAAAIRILRARAGSERDILVAHIDQPQNEFSALFRTLLTDPASYLCHDAHAFGCAVGRSFYQQVLPANSVTLGWSSWAIQWLSRCPGEIPDHVQVAFSLDPSAREAYSRQSAEDWRAFLSARERELSPGGRLVIIAMGIDSDGRFGYQALVDGMYAALTEMVESGFLRAQELRRMNILTVARSREDILAPFDAALRFGSLRLEEVDVFDSEDHIWKQFEQDRDAHAFGAQWTAFTRASVFPTLAQGLDDPSRATEFMDRLSVGVASRLASKPEAMRIPMVKVLLAKEG